MTTRSRFAGRTAMLPALLLAPAGAVTLGSCDDASRPVDRGRSTMAHEANRGGGAPAVAPVPRPGEAPAVLTFQDVAPRDAVALNASVPVATGPVQAAAPFRLASSIDPVARAAATDCLASAIYYEAAGEGAAGQRAVAQVVLNRLRHPAYPKTVCGVIFQGSERATGCQFTFTCDGSLQRAPVPSLWMQARRLAEQALAGQVERAVGLSTHYHTQWVVPYWRTDLVKSAVLGAHIFYRWQGAWGQRRSFLFSHAGTEVLPEKLSHGVPAFLLASGQVGGMPGQSLPEVHLASAPALPPGAGPGAAPDRRLAADDRRAVPLADQASGSLLLADSAAPRLP